MTRNRHNKGSFRPITVLVVEDEERIRRNLVRLLRTREELDILDAVATGEQGISAARRLEPDVLLLDLGLPDMDGVEVVREIRRRKLATEVVVYTVFEDEERVLDAVRAGAGGYLLKGMSTDTIVQALVDVAQGGSVIQPRLARRLLSRFRAPEQTEPVPRLSARETEILQLIAKGLTNRQVAEVLGLSRSTVRTHLEHIYAKLDVSNRTEAVTEGIRQGLIDV